MSIFSEQEPKRGSQQRQQQAQTEYRVAEVREDGTAILELGDGRMFPAQVGDGVTLRKGSRVNINTSEQDKEGVPTDAVVSKRLDND